ncbi:hypothetical protein M8542_38290 [Amycolatopsis sp. OK19-0408]|uniref:Leucine rich repeat variant n=1 Tax=Amycolatopsis iheyensis TaxID=2945988 RepID=A0A9X2SQI6_9PSEU|nr:hypothetical protein [Amycolatopsis iheyensis]MCR6488695.1 hypothetical protein [Amycolatopsis iheyensis]
MVDGLRPALAGLAANPAAPVDVLSRLTADRHAAAKMAWRQPNLPDVVVTRLLDLGDPAIALALDSPRRSPASRQRVAAHPDVEIRCALRNFVDHTIRSGVRVMPDELAEYAGPGGLAGLAGHEDPVLRAAVAKTWEAMPVAVRRALLADPDPRVRAAAAGYPHPPAPADLHAALMADAATRPAAAAYATLTAESLRECLAGDEELRAEVAINPALPPEAVDRLVEDPSPVVRARVVLRQDLPEDRRRRLHAALLADSSDVVAVLMLDHDQPTWLPDRPLAERVAHLDSPIPCFRRCAARSPDLPAAVVRRLHEHEDVEVRRIVAWRPDTPGEVLEGLVSEHGESPRRRPGLTKHPNFPPEGFVRLAGADDSRRRALAAEGPDLPEAVLAALARDPVVSVRAAAARHRRVPVAALEVLLSDSAKVAEAAAANPALPADRMRALLDEAGL